MLISFFIITLTNDMIDAEGKLGTQKTQAKAKAMAFKQVNTMKHSKYNYNCKYGDQIILYNTFSGNIVLLSEKELGEFNALSNMSGEEYKEYKKRGFLIEDDIDEFAIMQFDNAYYNMKNPPRFRILTTTGCNAKCGYCYEAGTPIKTMTRDTALKVVSFIERNAERSHPIDLEWFGGEPLVNKGIIDVICQKLMADGYEIKSSIVTNGILLDAKAVDHLKTMAHLERVQITLDGLGEVYDRVKQVSKGTFQIVLNNILYAAENDISVHVRLNLTDRVDEVRELIEWLGANVGFNHKVFYYLYPIFKSGREVSRDRMIQLLGLNDVLLDSGLMKSADLYKLPYRRTRCFATNLSGYTIAPDGALYNCSHVMTTEAPIGTVENNSSYNSRRIRFMSLNVSAECRECVYYPLCKGGCRTAELGLAELNQCTIYKSCLDMVLRRVLEYKGKEKYEMTVIRNGSEIQELKSAGRLAMDSALFVAESCNNDGDCWDCDGCGGSVTH